MDTYVPATMMTYLEVFRQHFPAQHFAYFRGYVWALAMLGTARKCMTNIAHSCVFVERHLASWERFLSGAQWDLRGVSQQLVTQLRQHWGTNLCFWGALLAAVDTTLIPKVRGQMPGVQKWHDHSSNPARGPSLGTDRARVGLGRWLSLLAGAGAVVAWTAQSPGLRRGPWRRATLGLLVGSRRPGPRAAAGITVISRLRKDAVGWDHPAPVDGKRPRGRPRKQGRSWKLARLLAVEPVTALTVVIYGREERVCVVWRDVWLRDITSKVRVVAIATQGEPILLVSTDSTLSPAVIIQLYAARFPLELTLRDLKQYMGVGDYQCQSLLAIHQFVHLALTAFCLWRLTLLQDQSAPWLTTAHSTAAGALTPLSFQRLHHMLRRRVLQRIFAASAADADSQKTEARYEQIFRIVA